MKTKKVTRTNANDGNKRPPYKGPGFWIAKGEAVKRAKVRAWMTPGELDAWDDAKTEAARDKVEDLARIAAQTERAADAARRQANVKRDMARAYALRAEADKRELQFKEATIRLADGRGNKDEAITNRLDLVLKVTGMDGKPTREQRVFEEVRKRQRDGVNLIDVCREIARDDYTNACKTGAGRWFSKSKALAIHKSFMHGDEPRKADVEALANALKRARNRALAKATRARPRK